MILFCYLILLKIWEKLENRVIVFFFDIKLRIERWSYVRLCFWFKEIYRCWIKLRNIGVFVVDVWWVWECWLWLLSLEMRYDEIERDNNEWDVIERDEIEREWGEKDEIERNEY